MHIPDGYLSPSTSGVFTAVMLPVWYQAGHRVRKVVTTRYVPLVALGSAFAFVVMMFNVPIPNGTTAHATGGALIAILLGPWAACIAMSVALLIQALFFGDGGILAFPANAFNMALVLPLVAVVVYRLLARGAALTAGRRAVAAFVGGYVGINAAALATAIEFGVQPELFHTADGTPLYAPFHLSQAVPAMMIPHLAVAGLVEGAVTAGVIAYLRRANPPLLRLRAPDAPDEAERTRPVNPVRVALVTLIGLVALTPLGLLASGGAFGEDAPGDLDLAKYHLDAVPAGLRDYAGFWGRAVLPDYGDGGAWQYIMAALLGVAVVAATVGLIVWLVQLRQRPTPRADDSEPA